MITHQCVIIDENLNSFRTHVITMILSLESRLKYQYSCWVDVVSVTSSNNLHILFVCLKKQNKNVTWLASHGNDVIAGIYQCLLLKNALKFASCFNSFGIVQNIFYFPNIQELSEFYCSKYTFKLNGKI